jgi:hypothetical protein
VANFENEFFIFDKKISKKITKWQKITKKTLCVCICVRGTIDLKEIFGMIYYH